MAMTLRDGSFRISRCAHGHVTLEYLDDGVCVVVAVLSRDEAVMLATGLFGAVCGDRKSGRRPPRGGVRIN